MSILLTSKYDFSHTLREGENLIFQILHPVYTKTTFLGKILKKPSARTLALPQGSLAPGPPEISKIALGPFLDALGRSWDALGTLLGRSWGYLGPS